MHRRSNAAGTFATGCWPRRDGTRILNSHGNGEETGGAPGVADVGGHGGPADERRTSLLRAAEPGPGGFRLRCVRRGVVRGLLRGPAGPPESASGSVFPDAVHRLFRGPVLGAGDCVAGGRFTEPAVVPGPGVDRGGAGTLEEIFKERINYAASGPRRRGRRRERVAGVASCGVGMACSRRGTGCGKRHVRFDERRSEAELAGAMHRQTDEGRRERLSSSAYRQPGSRLSNRYWPHRAAEPLS